MENKNNLNRTDHTDLFLKKHFLLATLPEKEAERDDFLKKLSDYLGKFRYEDIVIFHESAYLFSQARKIGEIFGIVVYHNVNLNFFVNKSREDDYGTHLDLDGIFLRPFINDYYKVKNTDRRKKVVVCITDDPYISSEVIGKGSPIHSNAEIVQNIKIFGGEKIKLIETGYNTILSFDFPGLEFSSVELN